MIRNNLLCLLGLLGMVCLPQTTAAQSPFFSENERGPGLSGTYSVGDAFADYEDLATALDAVMVEGIGGPVTLNLVPGVHEVHVTLGAFAHMDQPDDPLIIQSQDAMNPAKLQHDASSATDNWVLKLDGVNHVQVRNLIFEATGTADFAGLLAIENASHDIIIADNEFLSYDINPSSPEEDGSSVFTQAISSLSDINISNNAFTGGNMAIYLSGSGSELIADVSITENRFYDQQAIGSFNVVFLNYVNDLIFNLNIINNSTNNGKGLRVNQSDGAVIQANQISMLGAGNGGIGMRLSSLNGDGVTQTQITNNFILGSLKGLVLDNLSQQVAVYHNSILAHGSVAGPVLSYALQITTTPAAQIDVQNNLIMSTMTHPQAAIINYSGGGALAVADNNIYQGLTVDPYLYDGVAHATLGDYQLASGLDAGSLEKSVNFVDLFNGDFHLAPGQYNDPDLITAVVPGVVYDVDGETRLPFATHKGADDLDAEVIFRSGFDLTN